jgi:hypothetical protein
MTVDIEIIAGFVSFAALIIVWAIAPSKPALEVSTSTVAAGAPSEVLA